MVAVSSQPPFRDRLAPHLPARWLELLPGQPELGRRLIARYAEPSRRYHDRAHLAHVLAIVDELAAEADDVDAVRLAAWFHDAVYDVQASDNEDQSARLAEQELAGAGVPSERIEEVARLVRLTATHAVQAGDRNGAVLCDADLSILGAPKPDYDGYAAQIRAEYAHVPGAEFKAGRTAVLRSLLELPHLFSTEPGRERWEAQARSNVEQEIADLSGKPS
jgi:predicted metal-dependent HD superfamily phosphohydrolase